MSTYVIDHQCGHQIVYNLVGRVRDREWRAERLRGYSCDPCRRAARLHDAKHAGQVARHALEDSGVEMPPLTGSEKQVAWAQDLRAQALVSLPELIASDTSEHRLFEPAMLGACGDHADRERVHAVAMAAAARRTTAKWWIDRRRRDGRLHYLRALMWEAIADEDLCSQSAYAVGCAVRTTLYRYDSGQSPVRGLTRARVERVIEEWVSAAHTHAAPSDRDLAVRWWSGVYDVARGAMVDAATAEALAPPEDP